jgi:hypothetical protein
MIPPPPETIHLCPPNDSGLTPCCGRTPFELPSTDRMTLDEALVTCKPPPETPPILLTMDASEWRESALAVNCPEPGDVEELRDEVRALSTALADTRENLEDSRTTLTAFAEHHAATELAWDKDKAALASTRASLAQVTRERDARWSDDFEKVPKDRRFAVSSTHGDLNVVRWNTSYWWDGHEAHYPRDGKPPSYWAHWAERADLLPERPTDV